MKAATEECENLREVNHKQQNNNQLQDEVRKLTVEKDALIEQLDSRT